MRLEPRRHPLLIGVVHVAALPGAPRFGGSMEAVLARAERDARALADGGADALVVENFGDVPFHAGSVPPETVAALALAVERVARVASRVPIGVNVLRNDALAALGVCAATGASFVRVNVLTGASVTDQGIVEGRAALLLRERARIAPSVQILADVLVKHATPLAAHDFGDVVDDTVARALADGVIVTGAATGRAPSLERVRIARERARAALVFVGSGVDAALAAALLEHADGAIVGTALKRDGLVVNESTRSRPRASSRVRRHREEDGDVSLEQHKADAPAVLRFAIVTISDTRDAASDRGGPFLAESVQAAGHLVSARAIVRDEAAEIRRAVLDACARDDVDVVLTTGGTGIAPRDVTPGALEELFESTIPGFGELFRWLSYQEIGPATILSRACAGILERKIVIALPGSPKALRLAMEKIVLPEAAHLVSQARGPARG